MGVEELFKAVGRKYFEQNFSDNKNPSHNNNKSESNILTKAGTLKLDKNMVKNNKKFKIKCCN